ncbi:hypothetical protein Anapl_06603 [Anas platyrhynchos]|uniref:Uncharacterized protein n=1 Tax=Anas platyrhynchos TaxID=8839 RepID=R0K6Q3_ANAPL|nr:hypothetical protein Anapl_06603 [Anas platyrhynchos]
MFGDLQKTHFEIPIERKFQTEGPSLETQMVEDETETTSEELPPHLREEPPEAVLQYGLLQMKGQFNKFLVSISLVDKPVQVQGVVAISFWSAAEAPRWHLECLLLNAGLIVMRELDFVTDTARQLCKACENTQVVLSGIADLHCLVQPGDPLSSVSTRHGTVFINHCGSVGTGMEDINKLIVPQLYPFMNFPNSLQSHLHRRLSEDGSINQQDCYIVPLVQPFHYRSPLCFVSTRTKLCYLKPGVHSRDGACSLGVALVKLYPCQLKAKISQYNLVQDLEGKICLERTATFTDQLWKFDSPEVRCRKVAEQIKYCDDGWTQLVRGLGTELWRLVTGLLQERAGSDTAAARRDTECSCN